MSLGFCLPRGSGCSCSSRSCSRCKSRRRADAHRSTIYSRSCEIAWAVNEGNARGFQVARSATVGSRIAPYIVVASNKTKVESSVVVDRPDIAPRPVVVAVDVVLVSCAVSVDLFVEIWADSCWRGSSG
jgi:hypothetical protein